MKLTARPAITFTPEELAEAKAALSGCTEHSTHEGRRTVTPLSSLSDAEIVSRYRTLKPLWEQGTIRKPSTL